MAETDIRLTVDLDVKDAEDTAKDLQDEIKKIFDSRKGEQSASLTSLEIQMKKNYDAAEQLRVKMIELAKDAPTEEYSRIMNELAQAEIKYNELTQNMSESGLNEKLKSDFAYLKNIQSAIDQLEASGKDTIIDPKGVLGPAGYEYDKDELLAIKQHTQSVMDETMRLQDEIKAAKDQMAELNAERMKLENSDLAFVIGKETEEYQKAEKQLDAINDRLKQQYIRYSEISTKEESNAIKQQQIADEHALKDAIQERAEAEKQARLENIEANSSLMAINMAVRSLGRVIPGVSTSAITGVIMLTRALGRFQRVTLASLKKAIINAVMSIGNAIVAVFDFIMAHPIVLVITAAITAIILLVKKLKEMWDESQQIAEDLLKTMGDILIKLKDLAIDFIGVMAKGFVKLGTLIPSVFLKVTQKLIDKLKSLKSLVMENIKAMAEWNDGNNDINQALSNITSSLAYLKASITAAVAPIIVYVEPTLTRLLDVLGKVFEMIGMIIAKITGATTFQRAIRKQKDYAKSLEETNGQLASFDNLNVISQNNEGVDFGLVELQDVDLPDWFDDFGKLARDLSRKINKFFKSIDWDSIKKKAKEVGKAIADFINGINFNEVAKAIGQGINTITTFLKSFLKNFKSQKFGKNLAKFIKNAIKTIKWEDVGSVFSAGINKLFGIVAGFTKEFSGTDLGVAFSEFLKTALGEINWDIVNEAVGGLAEDFAQFFNAVLTPENLALVGTTLGETINALITGIKLFTDTAEWQQWGESIADGITNFFKTVDWKGFADAVNNFALGLLDMIESAVNALFTPIDGKSGLDIISEKIVNFIKDLKWEDVAKKALDISKKLRGALAVIWQKLNEKDPKTGKSAFDDIIEFIVEFLNEKENWERLFAAFKYQTAVDVMWAKIKSIFTGLGEKIAKAINTLIEFIADGFQNIGNFFGALNPFSDTTWDDYLNGKKPSSGSGGRGTPSVKAPGIAKGAVLPPNKPFLALVGDQKNGTNIEAPLDTIKQALAEVMGNMEVKAVFDVQGDPHRLFKVMQRQARIEYNQTGQKGI